MSKYRIAFAGISILVILTLLSFSYSGFVYQNSFVDQISPNRYITGNKFLQIENQVLEDQKISFDISWDASWRDFENYDAAWIFIKAENKYGKWEHLNIASNSFSSLKHNEDSNPTAEISKDGVGAFVYRKEIGHGDNDWRISFNLVNRNASQYKNFKVFGLEMVYIPDGAFEIGTLKNEKQRREVLTPGAGGAPYNPFFTYKSGVINNYGGTFKVKNESKIEIGKKDGNLYWIDANIPGTNTFSGNPEGALSFEFPKGTKAFYQMKYELSQGEYCNFLNTLSEKQQNARSFINILEYKRPIKDYRNEIQFKNGKYLSSRPNRSCNFISWKDGLAFADWAGLRHMTELEFEKSCRGPNQSIYREYVWGVNEINMPENMSYLEEILDSNFQIAKSEEEEIYSNGNVHASMYSYFNIDDVCKPGSRFYDPTSSGCRSFTGGDGGRGPIRKGIFGKLSEGSRIKAGASYYGAMELGGNLQEPVVTVGHPSGRKFEGTHGDGVLDEYGNYTNIDWMPAQGEYAFAGRGGCWKFHENHARISDRFKGLRTNENRRASHIGFRGVRTQ